MGTTEKPWHVLAVCTFLTADCSKVVGHPAAFWRDAQCVAKRYSNEGESFLTKTLPALGKAIDLALQKGPLTQSMFKRTRKSRALPLFLSALLTRIFDSDTGCIVEHPDTDAIRLVRQVCFWFKKLERGYNESILQQATSDLIETDACLPDSSDGFPVTAYFAQGLINRVFRDLDSIDLCPKHGPGAVAGGENVVEKRRFTHSYRHLEAVFRPIPFFFSLRDAAEDYTRITSRFQCDYGLSRVAFVEKDSSGPRVIGLEPGEYQYCQQAVKTLLYDYIEAHPFTSGHVNFTDQSINRRLTLNPEKFDTLDMSKASDRNSLALVRFLFEQTRIWPFLLASRTPGTVLPNGEILWYKKFAPMGSATCFPVQALTYWALGVTVLVQEFKMTPANAMRSIYVYGDDLVVPHGTSQAIIRYFQQFGLEFNSTKCCTEGLFRESCGLDAYDGVDVTPIRFKKDVGKGVNSWKPIIEHHNNLYARGYWGVAEWLKNWIIVNGAEFNLHRIPTSIEPLPVMHFLGDFSDVPIKYVDNIRRVHGWTEKPLKMASSPDLEAFHLRESLASEGPVGELSHQSTVGRSLALKYQAKPQLRWMVAPKSEPWYVDACPQSKLVERINTLAKHQTILESYFTEFTFVK